MEAPTRCDGCGGGLRQDEDVLDTWFSSALWPFSTLGWPERTEDLARYYPTNLLITGHDIIFFWVARMMMMGLKFMERVPFHEVYIHGLVRDAHGQKMSKSKGNTVDPGEVQQRYGTDAVRFTMAILAAPGNDIPLAPERMEGYRAFANKLWNAARFVLLKVGDTRPAPARGELLALADRWMLSRAQDTIREVERALGDYRFDRAADRLYHFVWHEFCDWYIEFAKAEMQGDPERAAGAAATLVEMLDLILRLLHPLMPYVSEELWHKLHRDPSYLALAAWPVADDALVDREAEQQVELLQELMVKIRNLRAESNIENRRRIEVRLRAVEPAVAELLRSQSRMIAALVRADRVEVVERHDAAAMAARGVVRGIDIAIPLAGVIDLAAERSRISRELSKLEGELGARARKLANQSFLDKAPPEIVAREREARDELVARIERLQGHLELLVGPARGD